VRSASARGGLKGLVNESGAHPGRGYGRGGVVGGVGGAGGRGTVRAVAKRGSGDPHAMFTLDSLSTDLRALYAHLQRTNQLRDAGAADGGSGADTSANTSANTSGSGSGNTSTGLSSGPGVAIGSSGNGSDMMISWRKFSLNDIVLFLPLPKKTETSPNRAYLAFHEGCPHHYLSAESTEWFRKANKNSYPHYIVGKIILVDELEAGPIGNLTSNPYSITEGTKFHVLTVESVTSLTRKSSRRSSSSSSAAGGASAGGTGEAGATGGMSGAGASPGGGGTAAGASPGGTMGPASPTTPRGGVDGVGGVSGALSPSSPSGSGSPYPTLPNWGVDGGGASGASGASGVPVLGSPPPSSASPIPFPVEGGGGSASVEVPSRSATPEAERLDQAEGHG